jgi:hypothetical protein
MNGVDTPALWRVGVGELIEIFQHALVALVPLFDQAMINWRGPNTYDDYERVAEALFNSIVRDSLSSAPGTEGAYSPGRYGVHEPGRELSRIYVNDPDDHLAFFELETEIHPFDTIVCQRTDDHGMETEGQVRAALIDARFVYEARFAASPPSRHAVLDVKL